MAYQKLWTTTYLMPKEDLPQLLEMLRQDITSFVEWTKDPSMLRHGEIADIEQIFDDLIKTKSPYDPGSQLLTSHFVPYGGQSCATSGQTP